MFLTCFKFCNYVKDFGRLFNYTSILSAFIYFYGLLRFRHQPAAQLSAPWTEFCRYQLDLLALACGVMDVSPSWRPRVRQMRPTYGYRFPTVAHANGVLLDTRRDS